MTQEKIKEEFSLHLFSAFAAKAGYKSIRAEVDEGIDLFLNPSRELAFKGRAHQAPSNNFLAIQMKATTLKQIKKEASDFRFYLKRKNFNDLIAFKNDWYTPNVFSCPLLLVLHVLPGEEETWINVNVEQQSYRINGLFYWYYPPEKEEFSKNPSKQPIFIKKENTVSLDFFDNTFNLFFKYSS